MTSYERSFLKSFISINMINSITNFTSLTCTNMSRRFLKVSLFYGNIVSSHVNVFKLFILFNILIFASESHYICQYLHLLLIILQTLLSKVTYNWGIHKAINLEEANRGSARNTESQALIK